MIRPSGFDHLLWIRPFELRIGAVWSRHFRFLNRELCACVCATQYIRLKYRLTTRLGQEVLLFIEMVKRTERGAGQAFCLS